MPIVRDVPLFPEGNVQPNDTWVARGSEAHDFRREFGIAEPFQFPITVNYTYVRKRGSRRHRLRRHRDQL